ncbi:TrkA, K transport system, NAD-binding component [Halorhabdus sp. SVX81]|nr:TrkA, K transport system, NAD-binding component [Halorhabdus sp. SVX81]
MSDAYRTNLSDGRATGPTKGRITIEARLPPMTATALAILLGAGFGLIVGTIVAGTTGSIGFASRYDRGHQLSTGAVVVVAGLLVGVLSLLIVTVSPGIEFTATEQYHLSFPTVRAMVGFGVEHAPFVGVFGVVSTLLGVYGYSQGDRIAGDMPATETSPGYNRRALAPKTVASADATGNISLDVTRDNRHVENGYSLSRGQWHAIESRAWTVPVDLPIVELESRLAARIQTTVGVDVSAVSIDQQGRATVTAEHSSKSVGPQLSDGQRAVTVRTVVPAELQAGDQVTLVSDADTVDGVVLGVGSAGHLIDPPATQQPETYHAGPVSPSAGRADRSETTIEQSDPATGEDRRVSVAVDVDDVTTILTSTGVDLYVNSCDSNGARGAFRQLQRAGLIVQHVTVDKRTREQLDDHAGDIEILAYRRPAESGDPTAWQFRTGEQSARVDESDRPIAESEADGVSDHSENPQPSAADTTAGDIEPSIPPGTEVFVIGNERVLARLADGKPELATGEAQ